MSGIYGEQLALNIGLELIDIMDAGNFRRSLRQRRAVNRPLVKRLYGHLQWIVMQLLRNDAVNSRIRKAIACSACALTQRPDGNKQAP